MGKDVHSSSLQVCSCVVKDNVWTFSQFWQLYNSVTLFRLAGHEHCKEWQVGNGLENGRQFIHFFDKELELSLLSSTCCSYVNVSLQVFMLALTFLVLFLGNFLTTLKVVHQKFQKNQKKVQKND